MTAPERKKGGIFSIFKNIQLENDDSPEVATQAAYSDETRPSKRIPFWRSSLSRRELISWLVLPPIPLAALVVAAWRIDIRWDGKPTYPPTATATPVPTRVATPTPAFKPSPGPGAAEPLLPAVAVTSTRGGPAVSIERRLNDRP